MFDWKNFTRFGGLCTMFAVMMVAIAFFTPACYAKDAAPIFNATGGDLIGPVEALPAAFEQVAEVRSMFDTSTAAVLDHEGNCSGSGGRATAGGPVRNLIANPGPVRRLLFRGEPGPVRRVLFRRARARGGC